MRFLVFNVVVAAALIYLFSGQRGLEQAAEGAVNAGRAVAGSLLGAPAPVSDPSADVADARVAEAEQRLARMERLLRDMRLAQTLETAREEVVEAAAPVPAPAAEPATPVAVAAAPETPPAPAAAPAAAIGKPVPLFAEEAPKAEQVPVPAPAPAPAPRVKVADLDAGKLPDVPAEVAQRRAEVLGGAAAAAPAPVLMSPSERRRELAALAEDMEMMFIKRAGQ